MSETVLGSLRSSQDRFLGGKGTLSLWLDAGLGVPVCAGGHLLSEAPEPGAEAGRCPEEGQWD